MPNALSRRVVLIGSASLCGAAFADPVDARVRNVIATSPDGRLTVGLLPGPRWFVRFSGQSVLLPSALGFRLADGRPFGPGATLQGQTHRRLAGNWVPPYGIASAYDGVCEECTAHFSTPDGLTFDVILRAYNAGVALRYVLRVVPGAAALHLAAEDTRFVFPPDTKVYASRDEGDYVVTTPAKMSPQADPPPTKNSDVEGPADVPVTAVLANGIHAVIAEADRFAYPRLMLRAAGPDTLSTHSMRFPARATGPSGPGDTPAETTFVLPCGEATPWRVVMVATSPAALVAQAGLVPTLARANLLGDVSWVKPGRAIRIRLPYTTERSLQVVAFAAQHKLEYVEYDWHWYGDGTDDSDATVPIAGLDLPRVIAEARAHGIGIILYVDRAPAMKQLDAIVKTYQSWGIAGIKFGFVWEGRQSDNAFIVEVVRRCGEHHLLVDLHDDLRPAGLERSLPNYIALEGVRGNEHFPTPRHNVTLPFTRNLIGPIDYTICYAHPRNQTTNAHQLAMAAVYYNPLTFLYWYDEPDKYAVGVWPELRWFDECPTTWDETHGLGGAIGEYVAVARRHGKRWFLGVMTNEAERTLRLPLSFLGSGKWRATIYADGPRCDPAYKTAVAMTQCSVAAQTSLTVRMNPGGGQAVLFEPVEQER